MGYTEAEFRELTDISAARAQECIDDEHQCENDPEGNFAAFVREHGEHDAYTGDEILNWIGY